MSDKIAKTDIPKYVPVDNNGARVTGQEARNLAFLDDLPSSVSLLSNLEKDKKKEVFDHYFPLQSFANKLFETTLDLDLLEWFKQYDTEGKCTINWNKKVETLFKEITKYPEFGEVFYIVPCSTFDWFLANKDLLTNENARKVQVFRDFQEMFGGGY